MSDIEHAPNPSRTATNSPLGSKSRLLTGPTTKVVRDNFHDKKCAYFNKILIEK